MIDIAREIQAVQREVGTGRLAAGEARTITLRRTYAAAIDDVWSALTTPDRINRWFLPVSGDLRLGGTYQFEGNAGGSIVACDRPNRLLVTWGMGPADDPASTSEVEIRLTPDDAETTTLELVHTAIVPQEMWEMFGPGAVGVGWEGGALGLALHFIGGAIGDPAAWPYTDEGRAFYTASSEGWGAANLAAGAEPDLVARNIAATTQFYAPDAAPDATPGVTPGS
jgi:uncharacterized protein YndB with AHSA1/START domain